MSPYLENRRLNNQLDLVRMDRHNRVAEARTTKVDMICECGDTVNRDNYWQHKNHEKVMLG